MQASLQGFTVSSFLSLSFPVLGGTEALKKRSLNLFMHRTCLYLKGFYYVIIFVLRSLLNARQSVDIISRLCAYTVHPHQLRTPACSHFGAPPACPLFPRLPHSLTEGSAKAGRCRWCFPKLQLLIQLIVLICPSTFPAPHSQKFLHVWERGPSVSNFLQEFEADWHWQRIIDSSSSEADICAVSHTQSYPTPLFL